MSLLKTNEIQNYNGSSLTLTASTVSTSAQLNTGGNISVTGSLNVSDDSTTRTNLGLGTIATQDSDSITLTGGSVTGTEIDLKSSGTTIFKSDGTTAVLSESGGVVTLTADEANLGTNALVVDSSGNVGIGTSSPESTFPLTVYGLNAGLAFKTSASTSVLAQNSNHLYLDITRTGTAGDLIVRNGVGLTERMRIDSSGNVGIGTGSSISYQLQLSTDSAGKPSTNTWTVVSDERIKENIELADLDLCYDAVKNIPLKRFKWRDEVYSEEQVADRHKIGWIAQDVEAVYPKAVNIHEFKYNQVYSDVIIPAVEEELDEEGNIITEAQQERIEKELVSEDVIEDCRNLNADQIYAAMYGAIQKLIQNVEFQQSQIDALTARIEALETT